MNKILFVNSCVRENSRTMVLAQRVLQHLSGEITECNLAAANVPVLDGALLEKRDKLIAAGDYSDPMFDYAKDFAEADIIVIAAPCWDLTFPALLKIYLENITVAGIAFEYVEGRPHGLCKAKQLIYVATAGGPVFVDMAFDYIKTLTTGLCGVDEAISFKADKLDIFGMDVDGILQSACAEIDNYFMQR